MSVWRRQWGQTLVEAMVASAISLVVVIVAAGFLMAAGRWDRADRNAAAVLAPLRDAADYIARDARIADQVECCTGSRLTLHQKCDTHLVQVTYYLSGSQLVRSQMIDYDPLQVTERTVVYGLSGFVPSLSGNTVQGSLSSQAGSGTMVTEQVQLSMIPRLGVVP